MKKICFILVFLLAFYVWAFAQERYISDATTNTRIAFTNGKMLTKIFVDGFANSSLATSITLVDATSKTVVATEANTKMKLIFGAGSPEIGKPTIIDTTTFINSITLIGITFTYGICVQSAGNTPAMTVQYR